LDSCFHGNNDLDRLEIMQNDSNQFADMHSDFQVLALTAYKPTIRQQDTCREL
jgi:hypothetical protein